MRWEGDGRVGKGMERAARGKGGNRRLSEFLSDGVTGSLCLLVLYIILSQAIRAMRKIANVPGPAPAIIAIALLVGAIFIVLYHTISNRMLWSIIISLVLFKGYRSKRTNIKTM